MNLLKNTKKFSSCEYCCKAESKDDICDICLNNYNYEYYIDEENRGRCEQNCNEYFKFIRYDKKYVLHLVIIHPIVILLVLI